MTPMKLLAFLHRRPDLDGLLQALARQRSRLRDAETISDKLSPSLLRAAVAEGQGVNYMDASGATLVSATLDRADARLLAQSRLAGFRQTVARETRRIEGKIARAAEADLKSVVDRLLRIMARTDRESHDLREAAS